MQVADGIDQLAKVGGQAVAGKAIVRLNLLKDFAKSAQLKDQVGHMLKGVVGGVGRARRA